MDEIVRAIGLAAMEAHLGGPHGSPHPRADEAVGKAVIAALEAAGWVVMPKEPTGEMHRVGCHRRRNGCNTITIYKAMFAARPRLTEKGE